MTTTRHQGHVTGSSVLTSAALGAVHMTRLHRIVPCVSPPRFREPSRAQITARKLVSAAPRAAALTAMIGLVMGLVVGPRRVRGCYFDTTGDIASATVKKYAYEAYPSWSAAHPDKACPKVLEELNEYMNNKDIKDPWGGSYRMFCGSNLPAGARGIAVISLGEDGRYGTADDIRSY